MESLSYNELNSEYLWSQITKTPRPISTEHQSHPFMSYQCPINADPRTFIIWGVRLPLTFYNNPGTVRVSEPRGRLPFLWPLLVQPSVCLQGSGSSGVESRVSSSNFIPNRIQTMKDRIHE